MNRIMTQGQHQTNLSKEGHVPSFTRCIPRGWQWMKLEKKQDDGS